MFDYLLSLPKASWKARLFAGIVLFLVVSGAPQHWRNLHDDLAIARWIAGCMLLLALIYMPGVLVVLLGGRLPKHCQKFSSRLHKTHPQIYAEVAQQQRERRERTRTL